jgi:hypothetical protein
MSVQTFSVKVSVKVPAPGHPDDVLARLKDSVLDLLKNELVANVSGITLRALSSTVPNIESVDIVFNLQAPQGPIFKNKN